MNAPLIGKYAHVRKDIIGYQIRDLDNIIKRSPGHASLYILRGELYLMQKDIEGARESYRKALEINPKHPDALGRLNELKD
jgi:cytochrome c-type biogenesis protein CcmH/NrfG